MPFEFVIHVRGDRTDLDSGANDDASEGRTSTSNGQPQGLQMFLTENRIDLGNIMQLLFSSIGQRLSSNRPTAKSIVDSLPKLEKFTGDPALTCPICLEGFNVEEETVTQLECKHFFHLDCIKPWLAEHNTCPTCRLEMKTEEVGEDRSSLQFSRGHSVPGQPTRSTSSNAINRLRFGVLSRANSSMSLPRTSSTSTISNSLEQRLATTPLAIVSSPSRSTPRVQRRSSSNSRLSNEAEQASSPRQPRRGVKRNAQQQSQTENNSSVSEDRNNAETQSTSRRIRRRMNLHSSSSSSTPQSQQPQSRPHSSTPFSTAGRSHINLDGPTSEPNSSDTSSEPSTRASVTGERSRGSSLFPFSSGIHVQRLVPLPELSSADMEGPIQAIIASVSASTRVANTSTASSSSFTQINSRTSSRAVHFTRTSSGRPEGDSQSRSGGSRRESGLIPRFYERLMMPTENTTAESTGRDERPAPFRRRTNVRVSMRRLQIPVLRPSDDSLTNQSTQED